MTDDAYSTAISLRFAWDRLMARRYVSGPHPRLLKFKNPAVRREAEEDWGKDRWR